MEEIRFHGRGGQGAVTAVEMIAQAAISSGLYAQGFPNFGPERRGAPVKAFLRISDSQIYLRDRIDQPDVVVVLDASLIGLPEVTDGFAQGKTMIINATPDQSAQFADLQKRYRVIVVDASRIALDTIGLPITNTAIIGAFVKATGLIKTESLQEPFEKRFGKLWSKNFAAMLKAHEEAEPINSGAVAPAAEVEVQEDWVTYLQGEALYPWPEVEIGCDVHRPGSTAEFHTGNWRTGLYPVLDKEKCISCGICWIMCPDIAFTRNEGGGYTWQGAYCKGCGICVTTCPKTALSMEEEK